jgi:mRNA interferase MazF
MVARGEVWLAQLSPAQSGDTQSSGACLVISPGEIHDDLDTVTVAPISAARGRAGYRVDAKIGEQDNRILLDQITTIEKSRLLRKLGTIDKKALSATLSIVREMFAE